MKTLGDVFTHRIRDIEKPPFWSPIWRRLASLRYVITTNDATHPFGLDHVFFAGDTQIGTYGAALGMAFVSARVMGEKDKEVEALAKIDEFARSLR